MQYATREEWLAAAVVEMRGWYKDIGVILPERIRVSCAWAKSAKKNAIAWCWKTEASEDGATEVQVSPEKADPNAVLEALAHELIHASDNGESKHGGHFRQTAKRIGLEGKMTATRAGDDLAGRIAGLAAQLGPYPHATLNPHIPIDGEKKQTTRMLKAVCPMEGYTVRLTRKWVEIGLPYCPCGMEMELEVKDDDESEDG